MHTKSESINELAAALSAFQGEIKNPVKNREVTVRTRTGSSYKFAYATFDVILDTCRPLLAKHGLAVLQFPSNSEKGLELTTILTHQSGQWMSGSLTLPIQESGPQAMGSLISYARRYSMASILGIAAEEDDDANIAEGNSVQTAGASQKAANGGPKFGERPMPQASPQTPHGSECASLEEVAQLRADLRTFFPTPEKAERVGKILTEYAVDLRSTAPILKDAFNSIKRDVKILLSKIDDEERGNT